MRLIQIVKNVCATYPAYQKEMALVEAGAKALYTEFNRKKSAWVSTNVRQRETGNFDPMRMHLYRVQSDIFMHKKMQPKGKSHHFTILLDWSASFESSLLPSVLQCLVMTEFLRKAKIPFELASFVDVKADGINLEEVRMPEFRAVSSGVDCTSFKHRVWLSSDMSSYDYDRAKEYLWFCAKVHAEKRIRYTDCPTIIKHLMNSWVDLSPQAAETRMRAIYNIIGLTYTPLEKSLVYVREKMRKARHKNQIQNLVIVTDGASQEAPVLDAEGIYVDYGLVRCPHTGRVYSPSETLPKASTFARTDTILQSFDWGVKKIMFFVETMTINQYYDSLYRCRGDYESIRKANTFKDAMFAFARKNRSTPREILGLSAVDHMIFVPSSMVSEAYTSSKSDADFNKLTKKAAAKAFADVGLMERNYQMIGRRLGEIMAEQYVRNKEFVKSQAGFTIKTFKEMMENKEEDQLVDFDALMGVLENARA